MNNNESALSFSEYICQYVIMNNKKHPRTKPVPFTIEVTNRAKGAAEIRVSEGITLSASKKPSYMFGIQALDCGSPARSSTK